MALSLYFKQPEVSILIRDEKLRPRAWRPGRVLLRETVTGKQILIYTANLGMVKEVSDEEIKRFKEELEKERAETKLRANRFRPAEHFKVPGRTS